MSPESRATANLRFDVEQQLSVNSLESRQLEAYIASTTSKSHLYLLLVAVLVGSIVTAALFLALPGRMTVANSMQDFVPAICVFIVFALAQSIRSLAETQELKRQLRVLLDAQDNAQRNARAALADTTNQEAR